MNAVDARHAEVSTSRRSIEGLVKLWAVGTGIASLLVAAAYLLATTVSGPLVVTDIGEVTLPNVLLFMFFGATIGAALAYLVERFVRRPRMTFLAVTLIAVAGYSVVPVTAAETAQTAVWLNIFHVVVAIPVIGMLARYLPENRTSTEA